MEVLIRELRDGLRLSRAQLAAALGVATTTVSRWENGRSIPGVPAQKRLYALCEEKGLDLTDCIIDRIGGEGDAGLTLYHGSRAGLSGAPRPISRARCDFGRGFYMGTDPLQPLTLICHEAAPTIYALSIDMTGLKQLRVEVGIDWAMLIAYYRGYMDDIAGSALHAHYASLADACDLIVGPIADDRMYQVLTDFFELRITDTALLGALSALKLGSQYAAVTQRACERVVIRCEHVLSPLECMFLQHRSVVRRQEGLRVADSCVKRYRREGRYFDEIVRGEHP